MLFPKFLASQKKRRNIHSLLGYEYHKLESCDFYLLMVPLLHIFCRTKRSAKFMHREGFPGRREHSQLQTQTSAL